MILIGPDLAAGDADMARIFRDAHRPLHPPVCAAQMWQATPEPWGRSEGVDQDLSLGPNQRKFVLTSPVVPRSGRLKTHQRKPPAIRTITAPRTKPIVFHDDYVSPAG